MDLREERHVLRRGQARDLHTLAWCTIEMESVVAEANANATVVTALTERSAVFTFAWI